MYHSCESCVLNPGPLLPWPLFPLPSRPCSLNQVHVMNRSWSSKLSRAVPSNTTKACRFNPPLSTRFKMFPYKGGYLSYHAWLISSGIEEMRNLCWCWMNGKWINSTLKSGCGVRLALGPSSFCPSFSCQSTLIKYRSSHGTSYSEVFGAHLEQACLHQFPVYLERSICSHSLYCLLQVHS